jgi:glycine/D-amino acid oxidase-like deaminating enzyme
MISIWEKESFYRETDVLIAGSGLMSLWTAYSLKMQNPELNITIAEAQSLPALASTRNAGFACFGSPSEIFADLEQLGEDAVFSMFELRYKGIEKIKSTLGEGVIGFEASGGYEVFSENTGWKGTLLQDKLDYINKNIRSITGLENTFQNASLSLSEFGLEGFTAMAANKLEGGLHSGYLVEALYQCLLSQGVRFLFGHSVEHVDGEAGKLEAGLLTGLKRLTTMQCRCFLWATNAHLSQLPDMADLILPARGQVLVSPPIQDFSLFGTFHFDEGFYYFRNVGNRLLIGGARNKAFEQECTLKLEPTKLIRDELESFINKHIPQASKALQKPGWLNWAGLMGMSRHKLPFVTQLTPGVHAAFACNGMGVALTPMLGEVAAGQLISSLG